MNQDKVKGLLRACIFILVLSLSSILLTSCGGSEGSDDGGGGVPPPPGIVLNGGTVTSSDGKASVNIPAGALSQEVTMAIAPASNLPSGNVGAAYEFVPHATTFHLPVTIQIEYDTAALPSGTNELNLRLARMVNNQWQEVPGSSVNTTTNIVSGAATRFGIYGIVALLSQPLGIGPDGGTVISSDGKASVIIPAGALLQQTAISVTVVSNPPSGNIGTAYEFGPSGTSFRLPVMISIRYNETTLPSVIDERDLRLGTSVNNEWQAVSGSTVDGITNMVSGSTSSFSVYGVIAVPSQPVAVDAGSNHACAVRANGEVKCWGDNGVGQLGNGATTHSTVPVMVNGISTAKTVSAGFAHTCVLLANGTVQCWGHNFFGQLGNGTTTDSSIPVTVSGISAATEVSSGGIHTCALLSNSTVKCWGGNGRGELGNGATNFNSPTPVTVSEISNATAITTGSNHACALLADGTVKCWGNNFSTPVTVSEISSAMEVSAGSIHTCVLLSNSTVKCWGANFYGQLGNGTTADSAIPVPVNGISTAATVSAGHSNTCARLSNGTVKCWGDNAFGELGNGTNTGPERCLLMQPCSTTPVSVSGISTAIAVSTGSGYACALLSDGTVQCWGINRSGQLGNGTTIDSSIPITIDIRSGDF